MSPRVIGNKVCLGVSDFAEMILQNGLYADKSLLIKEVLDDGSKAILIARPRRWGKTLNMSMLQHFLADNVAGQATAGLFDKLSIAEVDGGGYMQHQGKHPVIFISFKDIKCKTFEETITELGKLVKDLYSQHRYLVGSNSTLYPDEKQNYQMYLDKAMLDKSEIHDSLRLLSKLLFRYNDGKKVYILIDEYDTPLNSAYGSGYLNDLVGLMKNLLSAALKDNSYLAKGIMTGIMRISKDSMLSGLNNLETYTLLNQGYSQHFGFIDGELELLFKKQDLERDEPRVKEWYNGYSIGGITMYNPWSILNCLKHRGEIRAYWVNTASDSVLKELLYNASAEMRVKLQSLIAGNSIEATIGDSVTFDMLTNPEATGAASEAVWGALLYTGYLTVHSSVIDQTGSYLCQLSIPNSEVRGLYEIILVSRLGERRQVEATVRLLVKSLIDGDQAKFTDKINELLLGLISIRDYSKNPEALYHGFMLGLTAVLSNEYHVVSNKESGLGYLDLCLVPKENNQANNTPAIIFEFKSVANKEEMQVAAKQALQQISKKKYVTEIFNANLRIERIIEVGLVFKGKAAHCEFNVRQRTP